jgi:hypothetical protein
MGVSGLTGDIAAARITNALNASGSAPIYAARAWVNFNGTGTVAIRESGNVSSITDNGTGDYTVNFTTAMADANYSIVAILSTVVGGSFFCFAVVDPSTSPTSSAVRLNALPAGGSTKGDPAYFNAAIFR